jgi:tetratricopeptide (TPR) repeat protein
VAASLNNLGVFHFGKHQYTAAEPLFQGALVIWEKAFGAEHQNVARGRRHLAEVYSAQHRYREAITSYQRVASIQEKSPKTGNVELAATLRSWAWLLRKTHRKAEAAELEERARVIGGSKPPGERSVK